MLNICIAEVKENADGENAASKSGLSQNVGQTTFKHKGCTDLLKNCRKLQFYLTRVKVITLLA